VLAELREHTTKMEMVSRVHTPLAAHAHLRSWARHDSLKVLRTVIPRLFMIYLRQYAGSGLSVLLHTFLSYMAIT